MAYSFGHKWVKNDLFNIYVLVDDDNLICGTTSVGIYFSLFCIGAGMQTFNSVTIINSPGGTLVDGLSNTFVYPILSSVTLSCTTDPPASSSATYQWDADCTACFPDSQVTENVTTSSLTTNDAGTFTCTVTDGSTPGVSSPFTLRVSCKLQ